MRAHTHMRIDIESLSLSHHHRCRSCRYHDARTCPQRVQVISEDRLLQLSLRLDWGRSTRMLLRSMLGYECSTESAFLSARVTLKATIPAWSLHADGVSVTSDPTAKLLWTFTLKHFMELMPSASDRANSTLVTGLSNDGTNLKDKKGKSPPSDGTHTHGRHTQCDVVNMMIVCRVDCNCSISLSARDAHARSLRGAQSGTIDRLRVPSLAPQLHRVGRNILGHVLLRQAERGEVLGFLSQYVWIQEASLSSYRRRCCASSPHGHLWARQHVWVHALYVPQRVRPVSHWCQQWQCNCNCSTIAVPVQCQCITLPSPHPAVFAATKR